MSEILQPGQPQPQVDPMRPFLQQLAEIGVRGSGAAILRQFPLRIDGARLINTLMLSLPDGRMYLAAAHLAKDGGGGPDSAVVGFIRLPKGTVPTDQAEAEVASRLHMALKPAASEALTAAMTKVLQDIDPGILVGRDVILTLTMLKPGETVSSALVSMRLTPDVDGGDTDLEDAHEPGPAPSPLVDGGP